MIDSQPKFISLGKNYNPGSMSLADGFLGMQTRQSEKEQMYFSMKKAKEIAGQFQIDSIGSIEAGLDGDWKENSCVIFDSSGWHEYDVYDHSIWATPIITIKFKKKPMESFECFYQEPNQVQG